MKKKKITHYIIHIGEDSNGKWHSVTEKNDGKNISITYNNKEHHIFNNKTVKNEMVIVFGLKEVDYYLISQYDEALKKIKEHNEQLNSNKTSK